MPGDPADWARPPWLTSLSVWVPQDVTAPGLGQLQAPTPSFLAQDQQLLRVEHLSGVRGAGLPYWLVLESQEALNKPLPLSGPQFTHLLKWEG